MRNIKKSSDKMILITGGCGYIGSNINYYLKKKGYSTVILDNLINADEKNIDADTPLFIGDYGDTDLLSEIFGENNIDCVIHLASYAYVRESLKNPDKYYNNNVNKTKILLKIMNDFNIKKMIFASSCSVYGYNEGSSIDETYSSTPLSPYASSKLLIENLIKDEHFLNNLEYIIFRYFNVSGASEKYGENHNPETHLIPLILNNLKNNTCFKLYGDTYPTSDGTCIRDFIHINDLTQAHYLGLKYLENKGSNVFNLGSGAGYTIKQIIKKCEKITNKQLKIKIENKSRGDSPVLISNQSKIQKELNWFPKYDINDIINSNIEYYKII